MFINWKEYKNIYERLSVESMIDMSTIRADHNLHLKIQQKVEA